MISEPMKQFAYLTLIIGMLTNTASAALDEGGGVGNGGSVLSCPGRVIALEQYELEMLGQTISPALLDTKPDSFKSLIIQSLLLHSHKIPQISQFVESYRTQSGYDSWDVSDVEATFDEYASYPAPQGCAIRQVAFNRGGHFYRSKSASPLDLLSKNIIELHEALYSWSNINFGLISPLLIRDTIRSLLVETSQIKSDSHKLVLKNLQAILNYPHLKSQFTEKYGDSVIGTFSRNLLRTTEDLEWLPEFIAVDYYRDDKVFITIVIRSRDLTENITPRDSLLEIDFKTLHYIGKIRGQRNSPNKLIGSDGKTGLQERASTFEIIVQPVFSNQYVSKNMELQNLTLANSRLMTDYYLIFQSPHPFSPTGFSTAGFSKSKTPIREFLSRKIARPNTKYTLDSYGEREIIELKQ